MGVDGFLESRASSQNASLYKAIETDNIPALQKALPKCGERCQEFFSFQRTLMVASLHGSHQAARYLLEHGASALKQSSGAHNFYNARTSLYTCEGRYLASLGTLDLAVANHDMEMLALLWPASDDRTRSRSLWTAAELDRLDMVQLMAGLHSPPDSIGAGTPQVFQPDADTLLPLTRESYGDRHETLLRAAASGAALDVGRWLLETRPVPLPATEIQRALTDLLAFALDVDTPRSVTFARLLLQHGADIQSATLQDEPALERAVRYRSNAVASLLLELGADPAGLSKQDADQLSNLLLEPDRPRTYRKNTQGCVMP